MASKKRADAPRTTARGRRTKRGSFRTLSVKSASGIKGGSKNTSAISSDVVTEKIGPGRS